MRNNQDCTRRHLTHDELKAAEAAFLGRLFNEAWSQAARTTYDGILLAKMKLHYDRLTRTCSHRTMTLREEWTAQTWSWRTVIQRYDTRSRDPVDKGRTMDGRLSSCWAGWSPIRSNIS